MATIFNHFYENKNAFLNPCDVIEKISGFPEVCITTFSESIIKDYVENNTTKVIANLYSANGIIPVYEIKYADKKMGLFLSRVGAPACVAGLEEIIALGAKKVILFGCCGILNQSVADGKIIVPSSAVRDEGTSYHYCLGSEEISAEDSSTNIAVQCLRQHGIPYVVGKVWTTDAIFRETPDRIARRKEEGAKIVEMEQAGCIAVAKVRGFAYGALIYGGDDLTGEEWSNRGWRSRRGVRCDLVILCKELVKII